MRPVLVAALILTTVACSQGSVSCGPLSESDAGLPIKGNLLAEAAPEEPSREALQSSPQDSSKGARQQAHAPNEVVDDRPVIRLGISFVATRPTEFNFESDFTETRVVWKSLIDEAKTSLDLAFFYASDRGEDGDFDPSQPTALSGIMDSLQQAAERGVAIRFLADSVFQDTYPALVARLDKLEGAEARILNLKQLTGGVMHAKYMIADSEALYTGSANFDWRSLEHVLELGMRSHVSVNIHPIVDVFNLDWRLAGGESIETALSAIPTQPYEPKWVHIRDDIFIPPGSETATPKRDLLTPLVTPVFSPKGLLPNEDLWDLPLIIERIENAQERVWIQVMTFKMKDRNGEVFHELLDPILAAAKRGVDVRLLVADWGKRRGTIEHLQELSATDGITVRMTTIPEHSTGHIPFARVIHAKYMVVDNNQSWLGSSNWEKGYFYDSRNVGVLLEGKPTNTTLSTFHTTLWQSPHTYKVDPEATYQAPNYGDRK